jgi:gliding motility-associated-like protein
MKVSTGKPFPILFTGLLLLQNLLLQGQVCEEKYISLRYKASTYDTFAHCAYNANNEILSIGRLYDYNGAGHIAKFSPKGTPLWSFYYTIDYFTFFSPTFFNTVRFNDFVPTDDGGMIVAGQVLRYYNPRPSEYFNQLAVLAKIDKFGMVTWSKTYLVSAELGDLSFSNIIKTNDGDFIAYMAADNGPAALQGVYTYSRVIRFSAKGDIKWSSLLKSRGFDAGGIDVTYKRGLTQLRNKNIAVADVVYITARDKETFKITDSKLRFLSLDYSTGKLNWESAYSYYLPAADAYFIPDINNVTELPDGQLSFSTSLYLTAPGNPFRTKKAATIITSATGKLNKVLAYHTGNPTTCNLVDVIADKATGAKKYLLNNEGTSILADIKNTGEIVSYRGYDSNNGLYTPNCFAAGPKGYAIFMSNFNSLYWQMLITDAAGYVQCADRQLSLIAEETNLGSEDTTTTANSFVEVNTAINYTDYGYPLKNTEAYPLKQEINCREALFCCTDIIDSLNIREEKICEGKTYTLPDGTVVKDSGTYYVPYKTPRGCDSIKYYRLNTDKNPTKLTVGNDTCMTDQRPILLNATPGYDEYSWMGVVKSESSLTITRPGLYWVKVSNSCGSKTDTIEVYGQCDFPVYIPSAFTPNGDNLNDYFGIPKMNKNRLIDLKIYNRWGQVVFQTNTSNKQWDGKIGSQLAASDVFVYYLIMEGLSGNRITQKGTFLLIR